MKMFNVLIIGKKLKCMEKSISFCYFQKSNVVLKFLKLRSANLGMFSFSLYLKNK